MKASYLRLSLVFLGAFALALYLLVPELFTASQGPALREAERSERPALGRGERAAEPPAQPQGPTDESETRPPSLPDAASGQPAASTGRLLAVATDAYGTALESVAISVIPLAGRVVSALGRHIEVQDLPPGPYTIQVHATGYVSAEPRTVRITGGATTEERFELEAGIAPAGRVVDAIGDIGLQGAVVTFANGVQLKTNDAGRFASTQAFAESALERITVAHPEFDILTYQRPPGQDPRELKLPLSRGYSSLEVRVLPRLPDGVSPPTAGRLELWYRLGGSGDQELRRKLEIPIGRTVPIRHLYTGEWLARVSFEDPRFGTTMGRVQVPVKGEVSLDLELVEATEVRAQILIARGPLVGFEVELRDTENGVAAKSTTDEAGRVRFAAVTPGRYRLRSLSGVAPMDSPWFDVQKTGTEMRFDPVQGVFLP